MRFRALYTRHVRQKHKVYHDGFVDVDEATGAVTLTDEGGAGRLASGAVKLAAEPQWPPPPDAEGLTWFEGSGFLVNLDGLDGEDEGGAGPTAAVPAPPPRPPRPALAPRQVTATAPPPSAPPAAPVAPPTLLRPRTDDEIMGVLLGTMSARPPPPVPAKRVRRDAAAAEGSAPPVPSAPVPPPAARWAAPRSASGGAASTSWGLVTRQGGGGSGGGASTSAPAPALSPRAGRADLRFPTAAEAARPLRRHATIADAFPSGTGPYLAALRAAVVEEMNLRLAATAARFHAARARVVGAAPPAATGAAAGPGPSVAVARACRAGGLFFYPDCTLQMCGGHDEGRDGWRGGGGRGRGRGRESAAPSRRAGRSYFLSLGGAPLPPSSAVHKDDLWVLSTAPDLTPARAGAPGVDRLSAAWVAVARAAWHGPNKEGRLEVAWCAGSPPPGLRRLQAVFALHAGEASSELAALAALDADGAGGDGLIRALAAPPPPLPPPPPGPAVDAAATAAAAARLNPDQAAVLSTVAAWVDDRDGAGGLAGGRPPPPPRLCVVHGPFGSGKSATLTALVRLLSGRTEDGGLGLRVLVAAHTNAAVDRVLTRLVDDGAAAGGGGAAAAAPPDLIRLGPLRRMDRSLLPFSLHAPGATGADAAAELGALLRSTACPVEGAALRAELGRVRAGAVAQRHARLGSASVVGATCVSAAGLAGTPAPADDGGGGGGGCDGAPAAAVRPFDVVVLDEASQVTEPLAALALLAARARLGAVIAGDPCQLPPVVVGPAAVVPAPPPGGAGALRAAPPPDSNPPAHGLGRSLLSRLLASGVRPVLLGTQYRCHPAIAGVANRLFYGGRLRDGLSPPDRPPLIAGLPPVACLDVPGGVVQFDGGRSAFNATEASAVAAAVSALVGPHGGLDPGRVGVIAPFRAHAAAVRAALAAADSRAEMAAGVPTTVAGEEEEGGEGGASPPPPPRASAVVVATVDAFQGLERDVVFLSPAVAGGGGSGSAGGGSGFAGDAARLCVAFTRARHHLVLAGSVRELSGVPGFREVVAAARAGGGVRRGSLL